VPSSSSHILNNPGLRTAVRTLTSGAYPRHGNIKNYADTHQKYGNVTKRLEIIPTISLLSLCRVHMLLQKKYLVKDNVPLYNNKKEHRVLLNPVSNGRLPVAL
jgi:hypothetical protein